MINRTLSVTRTARAIVSALALMWGLASTAQAQEERPNRATAKLVKEQTIAEPGKTLWIGVHFRIEESWHLYWPGHNDTGIAPEFKVSLPDGWTLGKARWGVPQRHTSPGDIVDYIYDHEMMVLFPLEVPSNVAVGEVVELTMDASWLVCSETCIPEKQTLKSQIRVGVPGGAKPVATQLENFSKARAAWPASMPEDIDRISAAVSGDRLTIKAKGATRIEFMPSSAGVPLADAFREGAAEGDTLLATLGQADDEVHVVSGIVAVFRGSKQETYWLELPTHVEPAGSTDDGKQH